MDSTSSDTSSESLAILRMQEQPDGNWLEIPAAAEFAPGRPWFAIQGDGNVANFRASTYAIPELKFLQSQKPEKESPNQRYKLIFFVPAEALEKVKTGIFAAGGGTFPDGKYSHCSFESPGIGQFLPVAEKGAKPIIGQLKDDGSNEFGIERVEEIRCEIMCVGKGVLEKSVEALKRCHPYEEPAYEVYKMENF
ncbi:hypothetical protein K440DRAFT_661776 [Wilcoxina mikolae CBS 423.85]|nr:hypothetical protein K440DRAFT_661776 [Wilcoxina mikolae CBS 423.85]